ncbi:MAG TPA: heavy metal translocating P-type ATPase [Candidatus Acidoferrum sp.]|nr:heavy metal translocating P-type ATPase [Candidatus Acidoferrum sp.]
MELQTSIAEPSATTICEPESTAPQALLAREPAAIAILAITGIVAHLLLRYAAHVPKIFWQAPLFVVLVLGGVPLIWSLVRKLAAREFGSDHLAGISIVASVLLGEYLVGVIVILMLSGGTALEQLATRRASSVLDALARRVPEVAHRKENGSIRDIRLDQIAVGDELAVFPHEICPVDGVVIGGQGRMNEAYLTGEPFEIGKTPGAEVLSGSINGENALEIRAEKLPVDSRYARIMRVMRETEQRRPHMRRLGDQLGAWYTPVALGIATLAWAITGESHRFLATVVVATPCPLLIAIPVAVIGAIARSARRGIIIKNPAALEQVDRCRTLIFDKTGTLTYGKPTLFQIVCAPGFHSDDVLRLAASLESYSKHPLAGAILEAARSAKLDAEPVSEISERPGTGLCGRVGNRRVWLTGRSSVADRGIILPSVVPGLECLVFLDNEYAATLQFHDAPRHDSLRFVSHLKPRHNVSRILIVSGDRDREVRHLAQQVGIEEIYSAKSPEEKVEIVRAEAGRSPTMFLGDGVNDAPAMQAATVGVAFGVKSDITSEAADAVVLETSLSRIDELMHIGRRMRRIALESAVGGMALSFLGMIAAAFGYLPPIGGAIAQEIIDLVAVLNAVRVSAPPRISTDF